MARILLVDDERDVVTLLSFLLEKDGHEVSAAYNGVEALAMLGVEDSEPPQPPDLIVLDVMMPLLDGYSVTERLARHPRLRGIPVIILTAKGNAKEVFKPSPNVVACLEKPFEPARFRSLVSSQLPGRPLPP